MQFSTPDHLIRSLLLGRELRDLCHRAHEADVRPWLAAAVVAWPRLLLGHPGAFLQQRLPLETQANQESVKEVLLVEVQFV